MLTKQSLMDMGPGRVFSYGEAYQPDTGHTIKWVAVRGSGYYDWAIYYAHSQEVDLEAWSFDRIRREGSKLYSRTTIQELVPSDEDALALYRD